MASLRRSKAFDPDGPSKLLFAIVKQLDLRSVDWQLVASEIQIKQGHAARMRYSRLRRQFDGLDGGKGGQGPDDRRGKYPGGKKMNGKKAMKPGLEMNFRNPLNDDSDSDEDGLDRKVVKTEQEKMKEDSDRTNSTSQIKQEPSMTNSGACGIPTIKIEDTDAPPNHMYKHNHNMSMSMPPPTPPYIKQEHAHQQQQYRFNSAQIPGHAFTFSNPTPSVPPQPRFLPFEPTSGPFSPPRTSPPHATPPMNYHPFHGHGQSHRHSTQTLLQYQRNRQFQDLSLSSPSPPPPFPATLITPEELHFVKPESPELKDGKVGGKGIMGIETKDGTGTDSGGSNAMVVDVDDDGDVAFL